MPDPFFERRKVAAEVKHRILKGYLSAFTGKAGSRTGRVIYVDGYARPGQYDDDSPGSPLVAADVADFMASSRQLVGFFVEPDATQASQLRANLHSVERAHWDVIEEHAATALPRVLNRAGDDPLLVFLDPYGLAPPLRLLVEHVMQRRMTTEVLLAQGGFASLNWWQAIRREGGPQWRDRVRDEYIDLLYREAGGEWMAYPVPVPQRWEGPTVYELVLFTRSSHGLWAFNDATARAFRWLHQESWRGTDEAPTLFADNPPDPRPGYVERIKANAVAVLRRRPSFQVVEHLQGLLDSTLMGRAGAGEILAALKELHGAGVIGGATPKARRLKYYVVTRGPRMPA